MLRRIASSISYSMNKNIVAAALFSTERLVTLNDLSNVPGAFKRRRRWGRGIGSGRGKNAGHGHQKSRSTPRGFEGGQTPLYRRLPKVGFHNFNARDIQYLSIQKIQNFIDMGRLAAKPNDMLTIRDLLAAGVITQYREGLKLLSDTKCHITTPLHLEVSQASEAAIKAIEDVGGTVTCVHFNRLALRAMVKPYKFELLPRRARAPPRIMGYYLDYSKRGYLSPEVQIRNLKLFGTVTSEEKYREEHEEYMKVKRELKLLTYK